MRFPLPVLLLPLGLALTLGCLGPKRTAGRALDVPFQEGRETSRGCVQCHGELDAPTMHDSPAVKIGCTDCHGGDAEAASKEAAHVQPRHPELWPSSANPQRLYAKLNREDPEFIRFVNPGDLRVAGVTCGGCHASEVRRVRKSMMTHGAMLWGAALYNNGVYPEKHARFGEAYAPDGTPLRLQTTDRPVDVRKGQLPFLDPLPRFQVGQPGNLLRVFERGGRFLPPALPGTFNPLQEPGKPDKGLSPRGLGTLNRTDPVWLGLQKTRLLDPLLSFFGTNDHPGDYRSSGCTACHVLYANDRDPLHSGPWAKHGNGGLSASTDPTIPKDEPGHPIAHRFTSAIPSSQCIVCHIHPGTSVTNTYLGTIWWDNETEGHRFYPKTQKNPTEQERLDGIAKNPNEAATRGLWSDYKFLKEASRMNDSLEKVQLADFHGHGWLFRKVFSRDRKGNLLDEHGDVVSPDDPEKFKKAVHLKDIHLEKGMHCVDCHFEQDAHGDGHLYGSLRAAVEISCEDCHGTVQRRAELRTTGPAAPSDGHDLARLRTPFGQRRFVRRGAKIFQRSVVTRGREWEVPQIADGATRNKKSWRAKTIQRDNKTWGNANADLAHAGNRVTCFSCHTSWMTSCFGCHLPMRANQKAPGLHNEGEDTRNLTSYCFQTLRADAFMLGIDGDATGNRVAPVRSACAVLVSSQNANREWVYSQQQTTSAEGFSGVAFSPHVPHTVRKQETKQCSECHLSDKDDNNAWMAQVLLQGTGAMNFMFRWVYLATDHGLEAVAVTEREEPQAVIGSTLHRDAYPDFYKAHETRGRQLPGGSLFHVTHKSTDARSVQLRGEYCYVADGGGGLRIFDVAQIDQKGFSERIVTAPVSPLEQRLYIKSPAAAAVAAPTTMAVDPTRPRFAKNREGPIHPLYGYLYFADRRDGLVLTGAATLLDGDPRNNVLERAATFNPDDALRGAQALTVAGQFVYVGCDQGVVVVDVDKPLKPRIVGRIALRDVRRILVQFRYAFVAHAGGVSVIDITPAADGAFPEKASVVAHVPLADPRALTLARTHAYVAAGKEGLVILDITKPTAPRVLQRYDADGAINDCCDVQIGITNASTFAYLADGVNGLRVLQLTSPDKTPGLFGFSPDPQPTLIATLKTKGRARAISRGLDRDRAVDEAGNQIAVFGRVGARPFNAKEMRRLYRLRNGKLYKVRDNG